MTDAKFTIVRLTLEGDKFELLAENDLQQQTLASCAVADQTLIVRTAERLFRLGE